MYYSHSLSSDCGIDLRTNVVITQLYGWILRARADPFDQRAFERVRADRKMGKIHPSGPTQSDRRGPVDPFPAQMWEGDGSARTAAGVRARLLMSSPGTPGSEMTGNSNISDGSRLAPPALMSW
jgi:hypothetical protein